MTPSNEEIVIRGARTHNLKNINLSLPREKFIVVTGLSGSGKSSLAFDTIFAEGQRRYVESLSAYARQFIRQMPKPDVDEITGLSPAISIDQKSRSNNPRSTVATITEIYDYLRVLWARVGRPHCLICGREINRLSNDEILSFVQSRITAALKGGPKMSVLILAPLIRGRKGEYYQLLYDLLDRGYGEVMIDGSRRQLREQIILSRHKKHDIDVLIDELPVGDLAVLTESRQTKEKADAATRLSEAVSLALTESGGIVRVIIGQEDFFLSSVFSCPMDGFSYPEVEPRLFSFNSPYGACSACHGLGTKHFLGEESCPECLGARLRPEALRVFLKAGREKRNIVTAASLSVAEAAGFFSALTLSPKEEIIAKPILKEVKSRLKFLLDVGLEYITLDRRANTLSGGEAQRIRLASQLGSRLSGTLYVLDEPTIGLHHRDNDRLIKTLLELRALGNTIIVVEHDEDTILSSDFLVDIGPGAGRHGGKVVAAGPTDKLLTAKKNETGSLTLSYLRGEEKIAVPKSRRSADKGILKIRGASVFNIVNQNFDVPLGRSVGLTGVSGSGKSTLMHELLYRNLQARFDRRYRSNETFGCREFLGAEYLSRVVLIDQSPIGRTPRSNPATYTGAFTPIRELFAATEAARVRGFSPSRFSFNVKGGRCEACEGNGMLAVEMNFLPTVYVICDICGGRRFDKETLSITYKKKNIDQVLNMTAEEALDFFADIPAVYDRLKTLNEVGLGYLALGQSATTLSGGEAQRVKISSELFRPHPERTIYLLDEPTVGLHYEDVKRLIAILDRLVSRGNTVFVIEHNLDVIKSADWLIDMGPEGGAGGGKVVVSGTPEEVSRHPLSYTAKYLRRTLRQK